MVNLHVNEKFKRGDKIIGVDIYSAHAEMGIEVRKYICLYLYPFSIKMESSHLDLVFKFGFFNKVYVGFSVGRL